MEVHTKLSTFFGFLIGFSTFVVISFTMRDVELKMVNDNFPPWLTDLDKKFIHSTPEVLKMNADIVVAKDGTGNYKTVNEAVAAARERRFTIYVKKGVYSENIEIGKLKTKLTLVGSGRDTTILTGRLNARDGYPITKSATFATNADGFMAIDICFQNTAGPEKGQAVALRVTADVSVIYRCRIDGYQDTLLADMYRQFYRDCYITGTIDFIFGNAAAVFQNCQIVARKPMSGQSNVITAQGRSQRNQNSGFLLQKCSITASSDLVPIKKTVKTFLGRPWKVFSRVVIMQSFIDDLVDPEGWVSWDKDTGRLSSPFYREYENHGPGADTSKRVKWQGYKGINAPMRQQNSRWSISLTKSCGLILRECLIRKDFDDLRLC